MCIVDVILVFGVFGECGMEGMIKVIIWVCIKKIFFFGVCMGM